MTILNKKDKTPMNLLLYVLTTQNITETSFPLPHYCKVLCNSLEGAEKAHLPEDLWDHIEWLLVVDHV